MFCQTSRLLKSGGLPKVVLFLLTITSMKFGVALILVLFSSQMFAMNKVDDCREKLLPFVQRVTKIITVGKRIGWENDEGVKAIRQWVPQAKDEWNGCKNNADLSIPGAHLYAETVVDGAELVFKICELKIDSIMYKQRAGINSQFGKVLFGITFALHDTLLANSSIQSVEIQMNRVTNPFLWELFKESGFTLRYETPSDGSDDPHKGFSIRMSREDFLSVN